MRIRDAAIFLVLGFVIFTYGAVRGAQVVSNDAIERGYAEDCGRSWEWAGECDREGGK